MRTVTFLPTTSSESHPKILSAAGLKERMTPSSSVVTMPSTALSRKADKLSSESGGEANKDSSSRNRKSLTYAASLPYKLRQTVIKQLGAQEEEN
jgi:hypothetical protein